MANPKKRSITPKDPGEALAQIEAPKIKWQTIGLIAAAFAVVWVTAIMVKQQVGGVLGWASIFVVGALTLAAIGFGIYLWRMTARQRAIFEIMKTATDPEGRKRAIEELGGSGNQDAMKAVAQAQLLAATDPAAAQQVLESIDLKKAPMVVQDEVRAQLGVLYLRGNRVREARAMADEIRLDRQPHAKSKAFYAAVMAEALARTGAAEEAKKLLDTYTDDDPAYAEARPLLLRAQVYTALQLKKRGLAKKAMDTLAEIEPGMLGAFMMKGTQPEIIQLAKQTLAASGYAPKMKMKRSP